MWDLIRSTLAWHKQLYKSFLLFERWCCGSKLTHASCGLASLKFKVRIHSFSCIKIPAGSYASSSGLNFWTIPVSRIILHLWWCYADGISSENWFCSVHLIYSRADVISHDVQDFLLLSRRGQGWPCYESKCVIYWTVHHMQWVHGSLYSLLISVPRTSVPSVNVECKMHLKYPNLIRGIGDGKVIRTSIIHEMTLSVGICSRLARPTPPHPALGRIEPVLCTGQGESGSVYRPAPFLLHTLFII